jgi:hypothetical protein
MMQRLTVTQQLDAAFERQEERILELEDEVTYWRERYWSEIHRSIQHSEAMMGQFLIAAINGVLPSKPSVDEQDSKEV